MPLLALILKELRHHRWNALLSALALVAAVTLVTSVRTLSAGAERETRRVMRDLGFNLRIIPRDTRMDHLWAHGYSDATMPEDTVRKLAAQRGIFLTFNHLTATLQQRFPVAGTEAILQGLAPSVIGPGEAKQPMGFQIATGHVYLGREIATRLGAQPSRNITLGTRTFQVERVLAESGTDDDIRIFTALPDAQALLGLPGRINEIKAIDCLCLTADQDPLRQLRETLENALPEVKVLQLRSLADARARARQMAEHYAALAVPLVLLAAGAWVGALAALNVRERRPEIGLWRALGHRPSRLAALFLGKAAFLGALAGLLGWATGTALALHYGPGLFQLTAKALQPDYTLAALALLVTPAFAALAAFVPAMMAVAQDPADALRAD
jgi:putative ABC transport system permease protein